MAKPISAAAHRAKLANRRERRAKRHEEARQAEAAAIAEVEVQERASAPAEEKVDRKLLGLKTEELPRGGPKVIKKAREQLAEAFIAIGDVAALTKWGKVNPTEFYRIWARMVTPEKDAGDSAMPLEMLLARLAERSDEPVSVAARAIGANALHQASEDVSVEDAVAAFRGTETVQ